MLLSEPIMMSATSSSTRCSEATPRPAGSSRAKPYSNKMNQLIAAITPGDHCASRAPMCTPEYCSPIVVAIVSTSAPCTRATQRKLA